MKTLDDAVSNQDLIDRRIIERNGISGGVTHAVKIGHRAEIHVYAEYFDQRAKELGFINGYRWGVEYPTNGKKPDLADNVLISVAGKFINGNWYMREFTTFGVDWKDSIKFKITDERYKPADTSYLHKPTVIGVDMASGVGETAKHVVHTKTTDTTIEFETVKVDDKFAFDSGSDWYDYENQKSMRFPPVGTECFYFHDGLSTGQKVSVLEIHKDEKLATVSLSGVEIHKLLFCARVWQLVPLDHAERKAELEKRRVVAEAVQSCITLESQTPRQLLELLYDKGYLHLPTEKN